MISWSDGALQGFQKMLALVLCVYAALQDFPTGFRGLARVPMRLYAVSTVIYFFLSVKLRCMKFCAVLQVRYTSRFNWVSGGPVMVSYGHSAGAT